MNKLLIIDDEDAMRRLYRRRLSGVYEVFDTGDPEQALALALEHKPDAILLDLKMPKYDGFELCQNFRFLSHTSNVPIFVITGQSGNHKEECEKMGASGYFEKPIDFEKLKHTLETTLKARPATPSGDPKLCVRVGLKLAGRDISGEQFADRTETESVSANGFSCVFARMLEEGSTLQVFLSGRTEIHAGAAHIVGRTPAGLAQHRYHFEFNGKKENWIIQ
jgi:DNA-binding response OmpR family regulator